MLPLAQPPQGNDPALTRWLFLLWKRINSAAGMAWGLIDKTSSNLTDIETRNHNDLQTIQGGTTNEHYHLTSAQNTDLTDGGDSALHYHATDRDRANHNGTQLLSTISNAGNSAGLNVGTTAGTVAAGDHNHAGVYEPSDATILKDADIGVIIQAYDVDTPTVSASQLEMETGTEVALRSMSPLRVAQAIASLGGGGSSVVSNVISSPKTIAADTSYIVASYLKVDSDLTINGNLMVIG